MSGILPIDNSAKTNSSGITFVSPEEFFTDIGQKAAIFGINLLWSIIILIFGLIMIKLIIWILRKVLKRKRFDPTIISFSIAAIDTVLKIILALLCINVLGIEMINMATILTGVIVAIGLSLSGFLQNFVSGMYLLISRPISVGNYVSVSNGIEGTVLEIGVVRTIIRTPDWKHVIIPNSKLASDNIINFDKEDIRRCDRTFNIPISEDINFARKVILRICKKDERILNIPEPTVKISEFGDNYVSIKARPYVNREHFWEVYFEFAELVKIEFERCGIRLQIPQIEIQFHNDDFEKPPMDDEYRKELEEAMIKEDIQELPKEKEHKWHIIPEKVNLWSWKWNKKVKESQQNDIEMGEKNEGEKEEEDKQADKCKEKAKNK